jgi:NADH dehydrogenase
VAEKRRRIVILGGGFAGVYAAKYLVRELRRAGLDDVEVALVSRENYLTFQPLLPEVIAGGVDTLHTISPIRRIVPGAAVYARRIEEIDLARQVVRLEAGYLRRQLELEYDHLVLALGNRLAVGMVPGLFEHAVPFKYLGDALRLRHHLVHVLEEAAISRDPEERRRLLTIVVAGGGFSGVECIAEMHDFLRLAIKSYPGIAPGDLKLVLLQSGETILPEMKPSLAGFAHKVLVRRGIQIEVNTRMTAVTATAAVTKDKASGETRIIPTRTVVATVPTEPHPLLAGLAIPQQGGKISVTPMLHSPEAKNVWAIGDCASIPLANGKFAPPTAQHAVRQGKRCAENIVAAMRAQPLGEYKFESLGSLASLGRRSAVAEVMGVKLSGFLAWIMWRAIYLSKFPGWERKIRLLIDWMADLFLPRDVTQLRIFQPPPVRREHFQPGETVFFKDDFGDRVYFVVKGEADVEIDGQVVNTVRDGDVVGEIALISHRPRSATVRAKSALDVVSVTRETFDTLVSHFPGVKSTMHQIMERHLGKGDAHAEPAEPLRPAEQSGEAGGPALAVESR